MSMRPSLLALSLLAVLSSACADQQESLIVLHAPAWPEDGLCTVDADAEVGMLRGTLDVSHETPYIMPAVLLNNLAAQSADDNNAGIVTNEVQITDATVKLASDQAPDLITMLEGMNDGALVDFKVPVASVSMLPGETEGFAVEVISQAASEALRPLVGETEQIIITATVVFHGLRAGTSVGKIGILDSREFTFPIQLCQGCLLDCSECPDPELCVNTPGEFSGGVCGNAQDLGVRPPGCESQM